MTRFGLIGRNIQYSKSPFIHQQIGKYFADETYTYDLFDIPEDLLAPTIAQLAGCNVTIPYKETVKAHLTAVHTDQGVNTIVQDEAGRTQGYCTDHLGFAYLLDLHQLDVRNQVVIILGDGATAQIIAAVVRERGASVRYVSRKKQGDNILSYDALSETSCDVLINATPVGVSPNVEDCPVEAAVMARVRSACIDVIYNPAVTKFLRTAEQHGLQAVNGWSMLVGQAVYAYGYFRQRPIKQAMLDAIMIRTQHRRIVLCGLPGSGKSTFGDWLASWLNYRFIDLDAYIAAQEGVSVPTLIETAGIAAFRALENKYLHALQQEDQVVISLGGGTVEAMGGGLACITEQACTLWIDSPLESIVETLDYATRPLLQQQSDLARLAAQRMPLYEQLAQQRVQITALDQGKRAIIAALLMAAPTRSLGDEVC